MTENRLLNRWGGTATVVLLAFLLFYFPSVLGMVNPSREPRSMMSLSIMMGTFYTLVFCLNYFWLVPSLIIRKESNSLYYLVNLLIIVGICSFLPVWFESHGGMPGPRHKPDIQLSRLEYFYGYFRFIIRDGIMMVLSAAMAYALRLSRERENVRRRELELNAEKREIELKNLKAQLNPHFLFNSLNNIYALIGFAPERARESLHDLSSMLRFMIYDAGNSLVPLSKEGQFIRDFTALMTLRLNSNISVECNISDISDVNIEVPPLLILTLVENAFKHVSPLPSGKGFIRISISYIGNITTDNVVMKSDNVEKHSENNGVIVTKVENTFDPEKPADTNDHEHGVGIENIKRQLRLLYPGRHSLTLTPSDRIFTAILKVSL